MRFEYINFFADSAQKVMEGYLPSGVKRGTITLNESISARGVSATIFLVGSVDGHIVLDLEPEVAKKIAGFMNNAEFERLDHVVLDTICELANVIIGTAVTSLNNRGFRLRPSPPCFFMGEKKYEGIESLCISLSTRWGDVRIQAAIRERAGFH